MYATLPYTVLYLPIICNHLLRCSVVLNYFTIYRFVTKPRISDSKVRQLIVCLTGCQSLHQLPDIIANTPRCITAHHNALHRAIPQNTILHCTIPYYPTLHHTTLHHTILPHITPHHTALYCITLLYITLHHTTPHRIAQHHLHP